MLSARHCTTTNKCVMRLATFVLLHTHLSNPSFQLLKTRLARQTISERPSILAAPPRSSSPLPAQDQENIQLKMVQNVQRLCRELDEATDQNHHLRNEMDTLEVVYKSIQAALERTKEEMVDLKRMNSDYQVKSGSPFSIFSALRMLTF